jgi:hypothetical protein
LSNAWSLSDWDCAGSECGIWRLSEMKKIEGITVTLYERKKVGEDILHSPIYEDTETEVPNVLVSPVTAEDLADTLTLTGRHAVYELAIPKGDAHTWENCRIRFFR